MSKVWMSCKEAAPVISASLDRPLGTREWLALKMHLAICKQCPQFVQQLETMRKVMRRWRTDTESVKIEGAQE